MPPNPPSPLVRLRTEHRASGLRASVLAVLSVVFPLPARLSAARRGRHLRSHGTDTPVSRAAHRLATAKTDIELPQWPENDASFDYRTPGTSGAST